MNENLECKICKKTHKTHWFEESGGERFICFTKRIHGENKVVKVSVRELSRKTNEKVTEK